MSSALSLVFLTLLTNLCCGLAIEQITVEGEKNQDVVLRCVHPQNAEVRWYKYLSEITDFIKILRGNNIVDNRFQSTKFGDNQTNLIILNIKEKDLGLYKCRGRSGDNFFSQIFNLTLKSIETEGKGLPMTTRSTESTKSKKYFQITVETAIEEEGLSQRSRIHILSTGTPTSTGHMPSGHWLSVKFKDLTTELVQESNTSEIRHTRFIVREMNIIYISAGISLLVGFLGFLVRACIIKRIKSSMSRDIHKLDTTQHGEVVMDPLEYMEIGDVMDGIVPKTGKACKKKDLYTNPYQHTIQSGYLIPVRSPYGSLGQEPGKCFSGQYVEPNQVKLRSTVDVTNAGYNTVDEMKLEQNKAAASCHDYIDIVSECDTIFPEIAKDGYIDMHSVVEERRQGADPVGDEGYIDMHGTESHIAI